MALPALPVQGQNPWYIPRTNWDNAVEDELDGRLSESGLASTFASRFNLSVNLGNYAQANGSDETAAIQQAVDSVPPGGSLEIPPGKMFRADGEIVISKPITVFSTGRGGFYSSIPGTTAQRLIRVTSGGVHLRGLRLLGPQFTALANQFGVSFMGTNATPLLNVSVVDCDISAFSYAGVYLQFCQQLKVDDNRVYSIGYAGVMTVSCVRGSIDNNDVWDIVQATGYVNSYGITASRTPGSLADSPRSAFLSISSNRISNVPLWVGIDTHGGQALVVNRNIIRNTGTAISLVSAQNAAMSYVFAPLDMEVRDNLIDSTVTNGTRGAGVNISGNATEKGTGTISGNNIRGHGQEAAGSGAGVYIENTIAVIITSNTIIEPGTSGINAYTANTGFTISNNTIIDQWSNTVNTKSVNFQVDANTGYVGENTSLTNGKTATYTAANGFGVFIANQPNNLITLGANRMTVTVTPLYDPGARGRVGFFGSGGATKAATPGTATGTDASVVNAVIAALRNYGLIT